MADASESVISKIRKLLAKARGKGTTVEEAATAASIAHEMMLKHKLSEIDLTDVQTLVSEMDLPGEGMMAVWRAGLLQAVAKSCFCRLIRYVAGRGATKMKIIGKKDDAEAAKCLYDFLVVEIERFCDRDLPAGGTKYRAPSSRGMRDAYRRGAAVTVRNRLWEQRQAVETSTETALVRFKGADDAVNKYFEERYAGTPMTEQKVRVSSDGDEVWANLLGRIAGEKISIPGRESRLEADGTRQIGSKR